MTDYKPGLYRVTSWRGEGLLAFRTVPRTDESVPWCVLVNDDTRGLSDAEVTDVRPLVVLDLAEIDEDGALSWADAAETLRLCNSITATCIADQIEAQTQPPRPAVEEPKGLGAVVEDEKGAKWVRTDDPVWPWTSHGNGLGVWGGIAAVRVLSEGVES